jgi:hypothetical protein
MSGKKFALTLVCLAGLISGCSDEGPWDGPAGTKMGLSKAQIEKYAVLEARGSDGSEARVFNSKQAPSLEPQADTYLYIFSHDDKLCGIAMHFSAVRKEGWPLIQQLKAKYGEPTKDEQAGWRVTWSKKKYKLDENLDEVSVQFFDSEPVGQALVGYLYDYPDQCE